ncbi:VOC family protein [Mumia sp. zg.B53]|uniref:VOC family protein n=1 Tax=unclassified Mumia TaxID=2621872 RepID=UPI001C6F35E8|nr:MULTISPECIES: VOC family protein [unclassified Mumia]MBW9207313.1 VOC family protein [Mumia sp. zg.B17]MBW9210339.1 VOC family protein [Mumia sp. zg.B21]MBW9214955.1 VOC family protein [Mumia sp. zg.B53]MDD9347321.1 VOC family protein [Mumia sp.]
MDQRVSFLTLAVADVAASRTFFVDGLGWTASLFVPGEVLMIKVADRVVLSLWDRRAFEEEVGPIATGGGFAPMTLAHNVATPAEVDEVLEEAVAAGAALRSPGTRREWGGYSGYFLDPDGYAWEVAYNPGEIGRDLLP